MKVTSTSKGMFRIELTEDELRIVRGCINEALEFSEGKLSARVGVNKDELENMMNIISDAYLSRP